MQPLAEPIRRAASAVTGTLDRAGLSARAAAAAATVMAGALVVLLGVVEDVTRHNGAATADPARLRWFLDHRPGWLVSAARELTTLGAVPVLVALSLLALAALWWAGQRLVVALLPALALGCTGVVVLATKQLVGRPRPGSAIRLVSDSEPAFPSGHSADSAAFLITLALVTAVVLLRRPLARVLVVASAVLASGLIGLSRLVLGAHWPTDVVAGWALGTLAAVGFGTAAALLSRLTPPGGRRASERLTALLLASRTSGRHTLSI